MACQDHERIELQTTDEIRTQTITRLSTTFTTSWTLGDGDGAGGGGAGQTAAPTDPAAPAHHHKESSGASRNVGAILSAVASAVLLLLFLWVCCRRGKESPVCHLLPPACLGLHLPPFPSAPVSSPLSPLSPRRRPYTDHERGLMGACCCIQARPARAAAGGRVAGAARATPATTAPRAPRAARKKPRPVPDPPLVRTFSSGTRRTRCLGCRHRLRAAAASIGRFRLLATWDHRRRRRRQEPVSLEQDHRHRRCR
ncbi:hypothetical protein GGR56DRAFT_253011 [Xylariaceae sp. FL0804]|nr:hypothetical protein GGR56DRAFT_253011 [Xylariaceae sp. FL0804]